MSMFCIRALSIAWAAATLVAAHGAGAQGKINPAAGFPNKPVRLLVASAPEAAPTLTRACWEAG